jgi:hypothetical protein
LLKLLRLSAMQPETDAYVRRPAGSCAGWPKCREPALTNAAGCAEHQPILARVGHELKAEKYRNLPVEKPAPAKRGRARSDGPEKLARLVYAKQGAVTLNYIEHELGISRRTATRYAKAAREKKWITTTVGSRGGYSPGDVEPPAVEIVLPAADHAAA